MVYVNSKKYACEACIKGHRSSSCHHNDRPLYEIKKKGRPVSQCVTCREARQTAGVHCKCSCGGADKSSTPPEDIVKKKGSRFVPQPPSLPNGLKDALETTTTSSGLRSKHQAAVDALLNPCNCADFYNCKCGMPGSSSLSLSRKQAASSAFAAGGLSTLALVAACCSGPTASILPPLSSLSLSKAAPSQDRAMAAGNSDIGRSRMSKDSLSDEQPAAGPSKRKRSPNSPPAAGTELPPVQLPRTKQFRPIAPALTVDTLPVQDMTLGRYSFSVPPIPTPTSRVHRSAHHKASASQSSSDDADDDCCCGTRCECADCSLHADAEGSDRPSNVGAWVQADASASSHIVPRRAHSAHPSTSVPLADCGHCQTCIDYMGGVELPAISSISGVASARQQTPGTETGAGTGSGRGTTKPQPSFLDTFFARAASLPTPPPSSARSASLDPTNLVVYPRGLFSHPPPSSAGGSSAGGGDDAGRAFGLVRLPKLEECCGGRCGCLEDACGCGDACGGCCMDGNASTGTSAGDKAASETGAEKTIAKSPAASEEVQAEAENRDRRMSPSVSFARHVVDAGSAARGGCCS